MADPRLSLIIEAKDRASAVIREVKKQTADLSASSLASLKRVGGGWSILGGGIGSVKGILTALAPEAALPITVIATAGSMALNGLRSIGSAVMTGLRTAGRAVVATVKTVWRLGSETLTGLVRLSRQAAFALAGVSAGVGYLIKQNVDAAAFMEQATIAYQTLLKSAQAGTAFVRDLQAFAARTPFEFKDLLTLGRQVLAYGFAAKEVIPVLTQVGDTVAALGGGADMMERVLRAIGQIRGKGKVQMQEMYQLAEAGIPVFEIFAQKLGLTQEQIMRIGEVGVAANVALPALFAGMSERYGGLMGKQMGTVGGMVSNLRDMLFAVRAEAGKAFLPLVRGALPLLIGLVQAAGTRMKAFGENLVAAWNWFVRTPVAAAVIAAFQRLAAVVNRLFGQATSAQTFARILTGGANLLLRAVTWLTNFLDGGFQQALRTVSHWLFLAGYYGGWVYGKLLAFFNLLRGTGVSAFNALEQGFLWLWRNLPEIVGRVTRGLGAFVKTFGIVYVAAKSFLFGLLQAFRLTGAIIAGVIGGLVWQLGRLIVTLGQAITAWGWFKGNPAMRALGAETQKYGQAAQAWGIGALSTAASFGAAWHRGLMDSPARAAEYMREIGQFWNWGAAVENWGVEAAGGLRAWQGKTERVFTGNVTVNIQGNVYGVDDLKQAIADGIQAAATGARYQYAPAY